MTRPAGAHIAIARIGNLPTRISRFDRFNAFYLIKNGFQAPETSSGQRRSFQVFLHDKFSFSLKMSGSFG
jgi:hypothetical protein